MVDPSAAYNGDDRADEATLAALRRLGAVPPPRTDFARSLKEELMHAPIVPFSIAPGDDRLPHPSVGRLKPLTRTLRHPVIGGLATAALLAVTLIGAYLAFFTPNDPNDGRPTVPAAAVGPSPEASPAGVPEPYECTTTDPYFECQRFIRQLGSNFAWYPNLEESALEARQVQLQGWAIAPGAALAGVGPGDAATGVVVDLVLSGAYVATFDVPVVVSPGSITNDPIQYLDAGATVELGRGDTVSYQLGGLVELHNPLSSQRIEFKRAVIYEGDISAFSATADGVTTRVEADAMLAKPVGSAGPPLREMRIEFWYLQIRRGTEFPPALWEDATVIGPVDPQRGPEGTDGFVLVIGNTILG